MATSTSAKAPLSIRSILPPPPSSAGVPRTVSCVHIQVTHNGKLSARSHAETMKSTKHMHTPTHNTQIKIKKDTGQWNEY